MYYVPILPKIFWEVFRFRKYNISSFLCVAIFRSCLLQYVHGLENYLNNLLVAECLIYCKKQFPI